MPTRGRDADDAIASLMQEMGQQRGYQNGNITTPAGENREGGDERASRQRRKQELSNYPDNTHKAGSKSIWNPLVMGECGVSRDIEKDDETKGMLSSSPLPFLLPTNPRIEVIRRRVFEKFRQEVQTLLTDFQTKNLSFASTSSSSGESGSFSKNKNKLPIPSMIEKWHMDAKLEERNFFLKNMTKTNASRNREDKDAYRPASQLSSTADILRERARRIQHGQRIYDPILLNKQSPQIFVETIFEPHVRKMWEQYNGRITTHNTPPLPPKFSKKAQQVQKGLYRLICEAIDSFESQLLQGVREESMRSTATRKYRKGNNNSNNNNKRPKIAMPQASSGGDDSSSASMVRVTFSGVALKLHRAYLEKLQRLYDRTEVRQDSGRLSSSYHHLSFEEALFCLLCRYDMIQGAGLQAGVPGAIMDVLLERFDCRMECFASPFNCRYDRFASAFADVDAPFGSSGSFFELPILSDDDDYDVSSIAGDDVGSDGDSEDEDNLPKRYIEGGICYEANPPFCEGLILQLNDKITKVLSSKGRRIPIMFAVFVPAWRDSECYQALLANPCLTKHLLLKQGEHWYAEGTQHRRKDSFRVASFDTSILFYQNNAAKKLWNLEGEGDNPVFSELRSAFGQDPGTMQKEQNSLEINRSNRSVVAKKSLATNISTVAAPLEPELEDDHQSFPASDRKKQSPATTLPSPPTKDTVTKPKKKASKEKKRLWNPKEEGKAQLALLESLGLSSTTLGLSSSMAAVTTKNTPKYNASGKANRKNKKRRKK